jgi:hypothetical protein
MNATEFEAFYKAPFGARFVKFEDYGPVGTAINSAYTPYKALVVAKNEEDAQYVTRHALWYYKNVDLGEYYISSDPQNTSAPFLPTQPLTDDQKMDAGVKAYAASIGLPIKIVATVSGATDAREVVAFIPDSQNSGQRIEVRAIVKRKANATGYTPANYEYELLSN